jgi:hypothetical protein
MSFCLVSACLAIILIASPAEAQLPDPDVTFIPDRISAESSFAIVADPGSVGGSVRITWVTDEGYGHFPYVNGRYMCYFSDTDFQSTCGPSPFRYPTTEGSPYLMDLFSFDSHGNQGNSTVNVEVGGLKISPDVTLDLDHGIVNIIAYTTPTIAESMSYKIFDENLDPKTAGYLPLERITATPYYNGTVQLDPGTYFIAFKGETASDFGGGMLKVEMAQISNGNGGEDGILQADPVDIDVLVQAGAEPSLPQNKRLINNMNMSFEGVTIELPTEVSRYLSITIPNSTIGPYETVYYTMGLTDISSSLDINTMADVRSGSGTLIGEIPIQMRISYTSAGVTDCSELADGADCLGGICCNGICAKKAECCKDSDCSSGRCSTSNRCEQGGTTDLTCSSGSCLTGVLTCPDSMDEVGTCRTSGVTGLCCSDGGPIGECSGKSDLETCSGGICCSSECVVAENADCCLSIHCPGDELCRSNVCQLPDTPGPGDGEGLDLFTLILVIAIVAVAGVVAFMFLKKRKAPEEEAFEEGGKKDEDVFEEEEFY